MRAVVYVSARAVDHATRCRDRQMVASLAELARAVDARPSAAPTSLDLVGHATRGHHYLRLGDDVLDLLDARVARALGAMVTDGVLDRAGVAQVRLLGCQTAVGPAARATLARLAWLTGRPVSGTTKPLFDVHHGPDGFRAEFGRLLVWVTPAGAPAAPWRRAVGATRA